MFGGCYAVSVFMILSDETFRSLIFLVFHQLQEMYPTTPFFFLVTDGLTHTQHKIFFTLPP